MKTDRAVLFLTDIFGVQFVNNRLLADNFARAGYFVAAPDLFKADPVGINQLSDPTFSFADWNSKHPQVVIDGIIDSIISALQSQFGSKKIAAAGYCFGGKFVTRHLAPGNGLDVGFTAHPSNVLDAEYQAVANPLSIAFGDLDTANPPAARASAESILRASNIAFQTSLYSNAEHGFAVRTNLSDPQKKFAQESAYYQAVRFFDTWM
ncbi:dienelactone hydrolase [Amylocarpus encephaloides]|uniref:Dienelactone hydrolase n=1 Tax=Amylocarpus encephaloides TaxID=45428 RepID=A0A9P7YHR6_9HELO|nr:dienelactone hydrolase [Amylocarpus encephaloides]